MRLEILDQAARDLVEGFRFYEDQGEGRTSLPISTPISSLYIFLPAFTVNPTSIITAYYPDVSRSRSFMEFRKTRFSSMQFWTAGAIPLGSENDLPSSYIEATIVLF